MFVTHLVQAMVTIACAGVRREYHVCCAGIFIRHEPVAAAEADASLLGSRATAIAERCACLCRPACLAYLMQGTFSPARGSAIDLFVCREVEQGLQQKSKHANAGHAGGKQSAQEHFPQLVTRGEGVGLTKDATSEQVRQ